MLSFVRAAVVMAALHSKRTLAYLHCHPPGFGITMDTCFRESFWKDFTLERRLDVGSAILCIWVLSRTQRRE